MVALEKIETAHDAAELKELIAKHYKYTGSTVAAGILQNWEDEFPRFVKVMPIDYKRALAGQQKELASK
jgi:glutamate synthase domain-containing protein 3